RQRPSRKRVDLLLAQSLLQSERQVRAVFVVGAVEERNAQDRELAGAAAEGGLLAGRREELEPALGHGRTVEERLVQVQELAAALGLDGGDELCELGMGLLVDQRYARQGASLVLKIFRTSSEGQLGVGLGGKQHAPELALDALQALGVVGF